MRIDRQDVIFRKDIEVINAATGLAYRAKYDKGNFVPNLLKDGRETLIQKYIEHLASHANSEEKIKSSAGKLFSRFIEERTRQGRTFSEPLERLIQSVSDTYRDFVEEREERFFVVPTPGLDALSRTLATQSRFPTRNFRLADFQKIVDMPEEELKALATDADLPVETDPEMRAIKGARSVRREGEPYSYGPKYEVQLAGCQRFFLVPAPSLEKVNAYFNTVLENGIRVMITLCSPSENPEFVIPFWNPEEIAGELHLNNGWTIRSSEVPPLIHYEGDTPIEPGTDLFPRLVERTLIASNEEGKSVELVHLHYENWPDFEPASEQTCLKMLLKRYEELTSGQEKSRPVSVNCFAGRGRTATFALIAYAREIIRMEVAKGTSLEAITLNIPAMLDELRREGRPSLGGDWEQLVQVYSLIASYYGELKRLRN